MAGRFIILLRRDRPGPPGRIVSLLRRVALVAGAIVLLVLLLPVIGLVLAVMLGLVLGAVLLASVAAAIFAWRLRRIARKTGEDFQTAREGPPPRKRIKVRVRTKD